MECNYIIAAGTVLFLLRPSNSLVRNRCFNLKIDVEFINLKIEISCHQEENHVCIEMCSVLFVAEHLRCFVLDDDEVMFHFMV